MSWHAQVADGETRRLLQHYVGVLEIPVENLRVTTDRRDFERRLGRRTRAAIGGAYAFQPRTGEHLILIHLARIDRTRPRAVEVVVAEELIHMRDRLDGDLRRHAKHGYDRCLPGRDPGGAAAGAAAAGTVPVCLSPVRGGRAATDDRHMVLRAVRRSI